MSDRKDLPSSSAPNFNQRLRETIQTYLGKQGDPLDRGVTLRDLLSNGIVKLKDGFGLANTGTGALPISPVVVSDEVDLTPPPQPSGFEVSAAISHVFIEHDAPIYAQGHGHLRTHVYGAVLEDGDPLPTFDKAVEVGQFSGEVWAMPSNPSTTWRLWIKWETQDGVLSPMPAGGTNGLQAVTGQNVDAMVKAMTGPGNPFTILAQPTTIDGFTYPAGTYSVRSFVLEQQVGRSQIRDLAVDNAKIANLSADKLTAGSIAVGQHIRSAGYVAGSAGWLINGGGAAEFSGVVIRGTVYATAGQIGGNTINSTGIQSPGYVAGSTGWRLDSSGNFNANGTITSGGVELGKDVGPGTGHYGISLSPDTFSDIFIKREDGVRFFRVNSGGTNYIDFNSGDGQLNIKTAGFSVIGGTMTVDQANVINTLNIAGQAVTIAVASRGGGAGAAVSVYLDGTYPVVVMATFNGAWIAQATFSILRNGSPIMSTYSNSSGGVTPYFPVTVSTVDYPPAGWHTYSLSSNKGVAESSIFVMAAKR